MSVRIRGYRETLGSLKGLSKTVQTQVGLELQATAQEIASNMRSRVPNESPLASGYKVDLTAGFRGAIKVEPLGQLGASISVNRTDAAYVEFGTGPYVFDSAAYTFTAQQKQYATRFIVNKQGRRLATPFFFISWEEGKKELLARLKSLGLK